jgi:hypothetical protein
MVGSFISLIIEMILSNKQRFYKPVFYPKIPWVNKTGGENNLSACIFQNNP